MHSKIGTLSRNATLMGSLHLPHIDYAPISVSSREHSAYNTPPPIKHNKRVLTPSLASSVRGKKPANVQIFGSDTETEANSPTGSMRIPNYSFKRPIPLGISEGAHLLQPGEFTLDRDFDNQKDTAALFRDRASFLNMSIEQHHQTPPHLPDSSASDSQSSPESTNKTQLNLPPVYDSQEDDIYRSHGEHDIYQSQTYSEDLPPRSPPSYSEDFDSSLEDSKTSGDSHSGSSSTSSSDLPPPDSPSSSNHSPSSSNDSSSQK